MIRVKLLDVTANAEKLLFAAGRQCYSEGWIGDVWKEGSTKDISIIDNKDGHVCTDKEIEGLVNHLYQSGHTSVLEHVKFTFAIDGVSRACTHQLVRHRIASYCVSADTKIYTSSQKTNKKSIAYLYGLKKQYRNLIMIKCVDEETGELSYNKCRDIVHNGSADVYEVEIAHGYTIKTTLNHRFLTSTGWKRLHELKVGDNIKIKGELTYSGGYSRTNRYIKRENKCSLCGFLGKTELHHIDVNPKHSDPSNILEVCVACHKAIHKQEVKKKIISSKIKKIEFVGKEDVYDIVMEEPHHNYIANGFVVHNSQQSQRYVDLKCEFSIDDSVVPPKILKNDLAYSKYENILRNIQDTYNNLIDLGIDPEDARYVLPNAAKTRIVDTKNCVSLLHFFGLRCCTLAQWEIRDLAKQMLALCKEALPIVFNNAGAKCIRSGYCSESKSRSCGRYPIKGEVLEGYRLWKESQEVIK